MAQNKKKSREPHNTQSKKYNASIEHRRMWRVYGARFGVCFCVAKSVIAGCHTKERNLIFYWREWWKSREIWWMRLTLIKYIYDSSICSWFWIWICFLFGEWLCAVVKSTQIVFSFGIGLGTGKIHKHPEMYLTTGEPSLK